MPDTDNGAIEPAVLRGVLFAAREAGFLGPGPIERHLLHARGFVTLARAQTGGAPARILDLGSGGGLPGLVVAKALPEATLVLLEANERRAEFLERAVITCGVQGRVRVLHQRAEICGRDPAYRAAFDGVVVRSFGIPAVVAECAAPLLRLDGWLIVSEPPSDDGREIPKPGTQIAVSDEMNRWPAAELVQLGLQPEEFVRMDFGYQVVRQTGPCPERFPRRNGVPSKRPLF